MFLLDWYRQWLTIRTEFRAKNAEVKEEETICKSCETLKGQLEIANYEKERLLNKLLTTEKEPERTTAPEPQAVRPKMVPWNVRRQMLEREDREKAKLLKNAPKPDSEIQKEDIAELEKELDVAAAEREAEAANK